MDVLGKQCGTSSILHQALCIILNTSVKSNLSYSPETLNSGQYRQLFVPCDLEIWQMTLKNNRTPLLCCFKLCASFHSHGWIQTGVTVWKRSIWVKIGNFLSHVTLKFDRWHWKTIGHLSYATSSFMHRSIAIGEFKLELQSGNAQFGSKSTIFLAVWPWNLTDDLENNRAPLLSNIKLCTSFHRHIWIQTGVTVRRLLNGVMISVTLTFDLWPWPFAWTSCLSMVITPENFRIRWQEHCQKGETDGRTDRQTDGRTDGRAERSVLRAAWSQLKSKHIDWTPGDHRVRPWTLKVEV